MRLDLRWKEKVWASSASIKVLGKSNSYGASIFIINFASCLKYALLFNLPSHIRWILTFLFQFEEARVQRGNSDPSLPQCQIPCLRT